MVAPSKSTYQFINKNNTTNIDDLNFSLRLSNSLHRAGINTIFELISLSEKDLLALKCVGSKSITSIKKVLESKGLQLNNEPSSSNSTEQSQLSSTQLLLSRCYLILEEYRKKIEEIQFNRENNLDYNFFVYSLAKNNYLNVEDIFNPTGIVPGIQEYDKATQEHSKTSLQPIHETQDRKTELLESIKANQAKLNQLEKLLQNSSKEKTYE